MKSFKLVNCALLLASLIPLGCGESGGNDGNSTAGSSNGANPGAGSPGAGGATGGAPAANGGASNGGQSGAGVTAGAMSTAGNASGGASAGSGNTTGGSGGVMTGGSGGVSAGAGGLPTGGSGGAASGGAGSSAICPSTALFCDDFEGGNLSKWTRTNAAGGTLTVSNRFVTSGKGALFVDIPAGKAGGFVEYTGSPLFPLTGKIMYGRAMVRFEAGTPDGHTDIIRGGAMNGAVPQWNLAEQHHEILLNYFVTYPGTDCWARPMPGYDIPNDKWMCWEWKFDGNTNVMDFYIDGVLKRKVSQRGDGCNQGGNQVWTAPNFASLQVGAYIAERGDPGKVWIDDVAVGTQQLLGCPQL